MARILKSDSDFAKRVEKVMEFMREQGVCFDIEDDKLLVSDTRHPRTEWLQCLGLLYAESGNAMTVLPAQFEYKLRINENCYGNN